MPEDNGTSPSATGLSSAAPIEPVPVSPVPASIPSADEFSRAPNYSDHERGERAALLQVRSFIIKSGRAHVDAFCAQRLHDIAMDARSNSVAPACRNCAGEGWVCEVHEDHPWPNPACCGGQIGSPCPVCRKEEAHAGLIHSIAQEARRYAAFYPPASDGRNTFEMFAEFVETRSIAQAIEARRAKTGTGLVGDESAVGETDAPNQG